MSTIKDPYGTLLVLIRDDPTVSSIVGSKVSAIAEEPPAVRLRAGATSLRPWGSRSPHTGVQLATFTAQCYGTPDPAGARLARTLAGAVAGALDGAGPIRGSTYLLRVWTPDIGEALQDPVTNWPYHTVRIEVYAATAAVA